MKSQFYENGLNDENIEAALNEADASIARLENDRAAIADRRRALVEPAYKTVIANPSQLHHKITIGAVCTNEGMAAGDADALAGLLALSATEFADRITIAAKANPTMHAGRLIVSMLDTCARELSAKGLFETWQRRLSIYAEDRAEWLARDEEFRLNGLWRLEAMTTNQRWLVRVTCQILRIDLPGDLSRGDAADWLSRNGANLNYMDFIR